MDKAERDDQSLHTLDLPIDWHAPENCRSQGELKKVGHQETMALAQHEKIPHQEAMALFHQIEPQYSRTNRMLANL